MITMVTPDITAVASLIHSKDTAFVDAVEAALANDTELTIEDPYRGSRRIVLKQDDRPVQPWAHIRISTRTHRVIGGEITVKGDDGEFQSIVVTNATTAAKAINTYFQR